VTGLDILIIVVAGLGAGFVNGMAGGGSLVSFPALLATGHGALVANVTNTVGILPGYLGGAAGFRDELRSQRRRVRQLAPAALLGGTLGGVLLLVTSESAFEGLAPVLIIGACLLFALQPRLSRAVGERRTQRGDAGGLDASSREGRGPVPRLAVLGAFLASIYGGYFGAGIGVIFLAILGTVLADELQRVNALRGILSLLVNGVAALVFAFGGDVHWSAAALLGGTSVVGGYAGARTSLRLSPTVLRGVVLTFGALATLRLLTS
jgi:uncharacterized membrane protein YfcA